MSARRAVTTTNAPVPGGPYSQGIVVGNTMYTAGFGPQDPVTGEFSDDIGEQTAAVLRNVAATLEAGGFSMADVVKTTVHLADLGDFDAYNEVYRTFFAEPYPARTTVQSVLSGIKVEIDVVAIKG